jgi:predicted nucleic acid-binding protein
LKAAVVDSSALLSLEDPDERQHEACLEVLNQLIESRARLLTTNFVFDETYTLILTRLGRDRAVRWGNSFKQGRLIHILRVSEDQEARAWDIILKFEDKDFSYTDATSFAVTESLGIDIAFSLDRHFRQYGGLNVVP